ncbi:hypothetical protein [Marinomonas flavescens]|uniref:hypothetical protein n=1 Tax=Marinomonas flavescens TaxID=2529379 RepID=UPI00105654F8|nr:hypothetical protein [Marinomonas flavescens]
MSFIKDNEKVFSRFIEKNKGYHDLNDLDKHYIKIIVDALTIFISDPDNFDKFCPFSILKYGDNLVGAINNYDKNSTGLTREYIISFLYTFIVEVFLRSENVSNTLIDIRNNISDSSDKFPVDLRRIIEYADKDMRIRIIYDMIGSDEFSNFKNISNILKSKDKIENQWEEMISEKEAEWHKEIKEKEGRVNAIKDSLDEYKNAFNFVGLNEGFHDLLEDKKTEIGRLVWWIRASVFFMIAPVLYELVLMLEMAKARSEPTEMGLLFALPAISLVVIATYFFRVLLGNYKGVKSQISQLELRMTLCRFIQSYAEYSSELKEKNGSTLEKFEDIVFSNIFANDDTAISAFDGIEQFSKLVDKIKR